MSKIEPDAWIDAETKVGEAPADHRAELRLWPRLLTCTTLIETEIRTRLREEFDFTLPRFDLLAQLDKAEGGMVLGELSKRLMVSPGNVTAIVERLLESGHITRTPAAKDRRTQIVAMTPQGRRSFKRLAHEHGEWIGRLFADLDAKEIETLMSALAKLKTSVRNGISRGTLS